jgi:hypothetical protein
VYDMLCRLLRQCKIVLCIDALHELNVWWMGDVEVQSKEDFFEIRR